MRNTAAPMPGRYAVELAVMDEMGWSWQALQSAPADLVEEILVRRGARLHWEEQRQRLDKQKHSRTPVG
jgi:IS5 family transposase